MGKKDVYDFLEKYNVPLTECYIDYNNNRLCWKEISTNETGLFIFKIVTGDTPIKDLFRLEL